METSLKHTGPFAVVGQDLSQAIQAREELLRQAWACVGANKPPGEIRSNLETLAERFPDEGRKALEVFNSLEAHVAALTKGGESAWLKAVLQGKNPDELIVQITPTAIVLHLPEQLFCEICPAANGRTVGLIELPEELRGRIILMPHPRRQ